MTDDRLAAWIPSWAFGRQFSNGKSVERRVRGHMFSDRSIYVDWGVPVISQSSDSTFFQGTQLISDWQSIPSFTDKLVAPSASLAQPFALL